MSIQSMTGFGSHDFNVLKAPLSLEMRTLNHRFLDVNLRLPKFLHRIEDHILKTLRSRLARGRVELSVSVQNKEGQQSAFVNLPLAQRYYDSLVKLGSHLKVLKPGETPSLDLLASFKDIFQEPDFNASPEEIWREFEPGLKIALDKLIAMRQVEGKALQNDMRKRIASLSNSRDQIDQMKKGSADKQLQKLLSKIEKIFEDAKIKTPVDESRVLQEAALLVERSDISEELERLSSHFKQFLTVLDAGEAAGRKLDFLTQEIYREINTVGSKFQEKEIAHLVVDFKTELERIREQVQNLE